MPLVSGVCRKASAPKLSHGGSRLNASKPEANPKTRCPPNTNKQTICLCILSTPPQGGKRAGTPNMSPGVYVTLGESTSVAADLANRFLQTTKNMNKRFYRIAIQRIAGLACLEGAKYLHDHKTFYTHNVCRIYTRRACAQGRFVFGTPNANGTELSHCSGLCLFAGYAECAQKHLLLRPSPNERTCMGWHERHASLRRGSRGILRPEALNLEA